mmetsp:Transcript_4642/g.14053  ORF Transcript_4642/g.14053 Transcript_4642/m.14053 type:complete len:161 (-) Transcript_4642:89-571(-)
MQRCWPKSKGVIDFAQSDLANCLGDLGRHDEALVIKREIYRKSRAALGDTHEETIILAINLSTSLAHANGSEAITLLRKTLPDTQRGLGDRHDFTFRVVGLFAEVVAQSATSREEVVEADALVEKYIQIVCQVLGRGHPLTQNFLLTSACLRSRLESFPA